MTPTDTAAAIRAWAAERYLPEAYLERWLAMDEAGRAAFFSFAQRLRLRTGQLVSALEMIEEISVRDGTAIDATLARDRFKRIVEGPGSAPGKARAFVEGLKALRLPRLGETMDRLRAEVAALGLPRGLSVVLPRELSSDVLKVVLAVRSRRELRSLIETIERVEPQLARIVDLLGGRDEL